MDVVSWPKDNSNAITKDHKVCTFDDDIQGEYIDLSLRTIEIRIMEYRICKNQFPFLFSSFLILI